MNRQFEFGDYMALSDEEKSIAVEAVIHFRRYGRQGLFTMPNQPLASFTQSNPTPAPIRVAPTAYSNSHYTGRANEVDQALARDAIEKNQQHASSQAKVDTNSPHVYHDGRYFLATEEFQNKPKQEAETQISTYGLSRIAETKKLLKKAR